MVKDYKISEPFFEYGPKCYMYGETLVEMVRHEDATYHREGDSASKKYIMKLSFHIHSAPRQNYSKAPI